MSGKQWLFPLQSFAMVLVLMCSYIICDLTSSSVVVEVITFDPELIKRMLHDEFDRYTKTVEENEFIYFFKRWLGEVHCMYQCFRSY